MDTMCPISLTRVNEKVVRINAVLAVISIAVFLWTPFKWAVPILAVDLFIRGFFDPSYSLYSRISKALLGMFNTEPLMVDAGPKIFAAKLGFMFCCVIFASHLLGARTSCGVRWRPTVPLALWRESADR